MNKEIHSSDCALHNEPAYPSGECDCGVNEEKMPTGGMAFPGYAPTCGPWFGMSMRDYFATKAMQMRNPDVSSFESIARFAYDMADAMIAQREKNR